MDCLNGLSFAAGTGSMPSTRRTRNSTLSMKSPETVRPCRSLKDPPKAADATSRVVAAQPAGGDAAPRLPISRSGRTERAAIQVKRLDGSAAHAMAACGRTWKFACTKQSAPSVGAVTATVMPSPCKCSARFSSDVQYARRSVLLCADVVSSILLSLHDTPTHRYSLRLRRQHMLAGKQQPFSFADERVATLFLNAHRNVVRGFKDTRARRVGNEFCGGTCP